MDAADQLLAIEKIKVLKARYFRYVDTKDWDSLRSVFSPDAVIEVPEAAEEPMNREDALKLFRDVVVEGSVSVHFGHMPEIEVIDMESATGIWAMDDRIYWPADQAALLGYSQLRGFGHYHETYRCVDGNWTIRTMRLTRLRLITQRPPVVVS